LVETLQKNIERQNFEIRIQACLGGKIVASSRVQQFRKDVLMKSGKTVGGGDQTRKKKLLEKQKEGKKRMKMVGNVQLSDKAFMSVMELRK
jgi:GTP-binding protein LepA